ncbi:hypothetical protein MG293_019224 [Ovis ammon polii]|uniref:Uncharacterized protein n=1 Tax=Ovis ammon polii TaxID=230172 RepID=A0AAD4XY39_OVIAM|nr:hypothetical protein MG293_019224 [Ovis ammon polii]
MSRSASGPADAQRGTRETLPWKSWGGRGGGQQRQVAQPTGGLQPARGSPHGHGPTRKVLGGPCSAFWSPGGFRGMCPGACSDPRGPADSCKEHSGPQESASGMGSLSCQDKAQGVPSWDLVGAGTVGTTSGALVSSGPARGHVDLTLPRPASHVVAAGSGLWALVAVFLHVRTLAESSLDLTRAVTALNAIGTPALRMSRNEDVEEALREGVRGPEALGPLCPGNGFRSHRLRGPWAGQGGSACPGRSSNCGA